MFRAKRLMYSCLGAFLAYIVLKPHQILCYTLGASQSFRNVAFHILCIDACIHDGDKNATNRSMSMANYVLLV